MFGGEPSYPLGVAVDASAGKAYWAEPMAGTIRVGNLDGSGSPQSLVSGAVMPLGVAVDPVARKLYWSEEGGGTIRVLDLNGTDGPRTLYSGESIPRGIAIDPEGGKIYWTGGACSASSTGPSSTGSRARFAWATRAALGRRRRSSPARRVALATWRSCGHRAPPARRRSQTHRPTARPYRARRAHGPEICRADSYPGHRRPSSTNGASTVTTSLARAPASTPHLCPAHTAAA